MIDAAAELGKIRDFVRTLRFDAEGLAGPTPKLKANYRHFHALLLWEMLIEQMALSEEAKERCRESTSDLATAYLLNVLSLYKPARLAMRSGLENFCRFALAVSGQKFDHRNVYELLDRFQEVFSSPPTKAAASALCTEYAELCKTVHSAAVDYMSLRVPFEEIISYDASLFVRNVHRLQSSIQPMNALLYSMFHEQVDKLGPRQADFLRDATPKDIKREKTFGT